MKNLLETKRLPKSALTMVTLFFFLTISVFLHYLHQYPYIRAAYY